MNTCKECENYCDDVAFKHTGYCTLQLDYYKEDTEACDDFEDKQ